MAPSAHKLQEDHVQAFAEAWGRLAPPGEFYMESYKLVALVNDLPPPLGFRGLPAMQTTAVLLNYIKSLSLVERSGRVFYLDVLFAVVSRVFKSADRALPDRAAFLNQLLEDIRNRFPDVQLLARMAAEEKLVDLTDAVNGATGVQFTFRLHRLRQSVLRRAMTLRKSARFVRTASLLRIRRDPDEPPKKATAPEQQ